MEDDNGAAKHRRINACSWPPSPRLITTGSVCTFNVVVFIFFLAPLLQSELRWVLASVFVVAFITTAVAGIRTMTIDPMDPMVAAEESGAVLELGGGGAHIFYCQYCDAHVNAGSKHCWECNKCASNFDHHCEWLNTCVGDRNYRSFFIASWSLLVMVGVVLRAALASLAESIFTHGSAPTIYNLRGATLEIVLFAILFIDAGPWILNFMLVAFHSYLCISRTTTYEYLGKVAKGKQIALAERESSGKRAMSLLEDEHVEHSTVACLATSRPSVRMRAARLYRESCRCTLWAD